MSKVRLFLHAESGEPRDRYVGANGRTVVLPRNRLWTYLSFSLNGPDDLSTPMPAIIDTATPRLLIPQRIWGRLAGTLDWLTASGNRRTEIRQSGGSFPIRLGHIWIGLSGSREELAPVQVIAYFAEDGGRLKYPLLGLESGLFAGRALRFAADFRAAWLDDAP